MSLDPMEYISLLGSGRAVRIVLIVSDTSNPVLRLRERLHELAADVGRFADSVRQFAKLAKCRLPREPLSALPPYRAPIAPLTGGRSLCAVLARGRLKRWRSLKEKRQAWGFAC